MKKMLLFIMLTFTPLSMVAGQSFVVTDITPADGSTSINVETTFSITFSKPVNPDIYVPDMMIFSHESQVDFDPDDVFITNDGHTVNISFLLEEDTDYNLTVLSYLSEENEVLEGSYTTRVTTASSLGNLSVTGHLEFVDMATLSDAGRVAVKRPSFLSNTIKRVNPEMRHERRVKKTTGVVPANKQSGLQSESPFGRTIVALLNANPFSDEYPPEGIVIHAIGLANPETGTFNIPYVREGSYFMIAVRFEDFGGEPNAMGYYDPEQTGEDYFVDISESLTNIIIYLQTIDPLLASQAMQMALNYAHEYYGTTDTQIMFMWPHFEYILDLENLDGRFFEWMMDLYNPVEQKGIYIDLDTFGVYYFGEVEKDEIDDVWGVDMDLITPVSASILDSDVVLGIHENLGGSDFRDTHMDDVMVMMEVGQFFWRNPVNPDYSSPVLWIIEYISSDWTDMIVNILNAETGEVIEESDTSVDDGEKPMRVSLGQNYPNPFNPGTTIEFTIEQSGHVLLMVYDVLGREVATLVSETLHAGSHTAVFDASQMPTGVYLYTLQTDAQRITRKMLLVK